MAVILSAILTDVDPVSPEIPRGWRRIGYQISGPSNEAWGVVVETGVPDNSGMTAWAPIFGAGADYAADNGRVQELETLPNARYRFRLTNGTGPITVPV